MKWDYKKGFHGFSGRSDRSCIWENDLMKVKKFLGKCARRPFRGLGERPFQRKHEVEGKFRSSRNKPALSTAFIEIHG